MKGKTCLLIMIFFFNIDGVSENIDSFVPLAPVRKKYLQVMFFISVSLY